MNTVLNISKIIVNFVASMIMMGIVFVMNFMLFWILFLDTQERVVNFPLWFKILLYISLTIVWIYTSILEYKKHKGNVI